MKWHSQTLWPETQRAVGIRHPLELAVTLGVLGRLSRCFFFFFLPSFLTLMCVASQWSWFILLFPTADATSPCGLWVFLV